MIKHVEEEDRGSPEEMKCMNFWYNMATPCGEQARVGNPLKESLLGAVIFNSIGCIVILQLRCCWCGV